MHIFRIAVAQRYENMDARICCVGIDAKDLSAEQVKKLSLIAEHTPGLVRLECYQNLDIGAEDAAPSGTVLYFEPSAPVDATIISDKLCQVLSVSRITQTPYGLAKLDDAYFEQRTPLIDAAAPQFVEHPAANAAFGGVGEERAWDSELGGHGSLAGVYFQIRPDHRTKDYFIAAKGTAPLAVQELKQKLAANAGNASGVAGVAYGQLVGGDSAWSAQLKQTAHLAQRNVRRTLARVAEEYGVGIRHADDISAYAPDEHYARPQRAEPTWEQSLYSIRSVIRDGKPLVAMYNGVVPREECLGLDKGNFFVAAHPYDGISVYQLGESVATAASAALPGDTGNSGNGFAVSAVAAALPGIVWENMAAGNGGSAAVASAIVGTPKPIGERFNSAMKLCGWNAERHVQRLVPVVLKLYNPSITRQK